MRVSIEKKFWWRRCFYTIKRIAERARLFAAFGDFNYRRFNCRPRDNQMRFPSCDPYANFAIKMFSRRKDSPLKSAATFVSLPIENAPLEGRRDLNANCAPLRAPSSVRWECAFRALRRQRINSAVGGFSVKPPRFFVLFTRRKHRFLLKGMHSPQLSQLIN